MGDSGLPVETLLQHLDRLPYPTYVVPGDGDARKRFVGRTGSVGRHFEMGPDLHVVIDSQNRRISPRQLSWLRNLAGRARSKGTRRLFAIVHHPPTYGRGQIALRRADSDAMLSALSGGPPVTLFAARRPGIHSTPRGNVQIVSVGPGRSIHVRVSDEGVTLQPEVKGP
jgi:3',5'-cyclic AMP phosphodiesterase CpdA